MLRRVNRLLVPLDLRAARPLHVFALLHSAQFVQLVGCKVNKTKSINRKRLIMGDIDYIQATSWCLLGAVF
jgi:hypothetical protein